MLSVVGIGADGWAGLGESAREALNGASLIVGSPRQLELLPTTLGATLRAWPSPLDVRELEGVEATVLASGDPLLYGIGSTLIREFGAQNVRVLPHVSAFSLACARMGWAQTEVELVSTVAGAFEALSASLQPGRRVVVYVAGNDGAARVGALLCEQGFGESALSVFEQLGGPGETRLDTSAAALGDHTADPLHLVALTVCGGPGYPRTPGLSDEAFANDGQLTKRHIRAITISTLGPRAGEMLWDIGAGSGSIAIEWLRAERTCAALAIEEQAERVERIAKNARRLGVPRLGVVHGAAPAALEGLASPDVVFIGGGITTPGLLDVVWSALAPGGRLVANTVTLEGEQAAIAGRARYGGTLTRLSVEHAQPVGTFTTWRPQLSVVQWALSK